MEDRIQKAVELFKSGYNCSQSVVAAFADMYGFTQEQALRMGASFGGGIGRMRETCGAACGMFLVAILSSAVRVEFPLTVVFSPSVTLPSMVPSFSVLATVFQLPPSLL